MGWYLAALKNYAGFSGRARRMEFWMFALINAAIVVVLNVLASVLEISSLSIVGLVYSLAVLVPGIAVTVRRLHDINKSGAWYFIAFVPFIGGIWLLVLLLTGGTAGTNNYGGDPKAVTA